jgi:hypothetical protein
MPRGVATLSKVRVTIVSSITAAVALAGCGTTSKSGHVGSTLSGDGVAVTLQRVDEHPPVPRYDVTGLSRPTRGDRLLGARAKVCSSVGPAIGQYQFTAATSDGGELHPKYAASNYPDPFDVVRVGCTSGWIVFEAPAEIRFTEIRFRFDNEGGQVAGQPPEAHVRFSWKLGG